MRYLGLLVAIVAGLMIVSVVGGVCSFAGAYASRAVKVISVENVEVQWDFAYRYDESLQAIARQVCTAEQAELTATNENAKTQRQTQRIAVENNYNRVEAEYNQALRNVFKAKVVAPPDVPRIAPTLVQMKTRACN